MSAADSRSLEETYATDVWARQTAPQSPYTTRQVTVGLLVFAVVILVAYGLPLALA